MLFVGRLFGANFLESNEKYNSKNETDLMKCLRGKGISLFQLLSEHEKKNEKEKKFFVNWFHGEKFSLIIFQNIINNLL